MSDESKAKLTTINAAIVAAQASAQAVAKNAKNTHANYKYASSEDVIEEARAALNGAGLALIPLRHDIVRADGTYEVKGRYALIHESGGQLEIEGSFSVFDMLGPGKKNDKAEASARTYLLAYTLRDLLLLPRVEEEQVDKQDRSKVIDLSKTQAVKQPVAQASTAHAGTLTEDAVTKRCRVIFKSIGDYAKLADAKLEDKAAAKAQAMKLVEEAVSLNPAKDTLRAIQQEYLRCFPEA